MAQPGYDDLMNLTDSRYRLSMIVARRAAQLKSGIPTVLDDETKPRTANTVTLAMEELRWSEDLKWGDDIPPSDELQRAVERAVRREQQPYDEV